MTHIRIGRTVLAFIAVGCSALALALATNPAVSSTASPEPSMSPLPGPSQAPSQVPPAQPEPPLGGVLRITSHDRVPMPSDPYMTSTADLKTIHIARDTGAAQCMRSLGFSGWTAETVITWSPRTYVEDDLFDYFDSADAARSGYSRPDLKAVAAEQAELVKQAERAKASTTAPTAAQMNVYEGRTTGTVSGKKIPVGGCTAEASRLISADTKLPMDPRRLAVTARISAFNDSRMRTAVVQWQKCMAEKGFDYADPAVARLDIRWASRSADSEPSQEELRVAIQDAHCQETTNLVGLYKTLRIAYETPLVSEHKSDLAASLLVFRQWVANAKKVIRAG